MAFKSKANSSLYTSSRDDLDYNNKYKFDEFYTIYRENMKNDNNENYKDKTMSNSKPSRNSHNFFTLVNRQMNKKNNLSQQNTIISINSYLQKNYSTNNLRKNSSNNRKKENMHSNKRKQNCKLNSHNSSSFNITNNTYNMNKNNIMINLNPKNEVINLEKLKVQKKLHEYQKLIDQRLNDLIRNKHPHIKSKKYRLNIRQNSSPNIYLNNYNNSKKKYNTSLVGINYYIKKTKQKNSTSNIYTNNNRGNIKNASKKLTSKSTLDSIKKSYINNNNNSQRNLRRNKNNSEYINNMKQNINKASFNSRNEDSNGSKRDDSNQTKGKTNLSLRKFIFAKCGNPVSKTINNMN